MVMVMTVVVVVDHSLPPVTSSSLWQCSIAVIRARDEEEEEEEEEEIECFCFLFSFFGGPAVTPSGWKGRIV